MLTDHLLEDVPYLGALLLDHPLRGLDGRGMPVKLELRVDERLEELERHLLRQAALMELELGADHDHRAAGIVDALAEQVLPEAALLALEHVGERLEWALVRTRDDAAAAAIVEEGVDRLLQHALFVAHDDLGCAQLDQALQAIVAVDHAPIEIVQVRGREAAAVERYQRAQLRRNHRDDVEDHPFGPAARIDESLDELEALYVLLAFCFRVRVLELLTQELLFLFEIDARQYLLERLGTDHALEGLLAELVDRVLVLILGQE